MLSVNQGMSPTSPESSLLSTAALLMKSTREGNGPNFDVFSSLNQFSPTSSPDMHSVWKGIFQRANNNVATTTTTPSCTGSNSNEFTSNNLHRTQFSLPDGFNNLALATPLLLQSTINAKPDPFAVSQSSQMSLPMNGHNSPIDNSFLSYSPTSSGYAAVPTPLSNYTPVSASHDTVHPGLNTVMGAMTTTPTQSSTSSSTLASIANITSALNSTTCNVGGAQFLTACTPLLQLAVRQALIDCLSTCGQVSIQGLLEITVNGMNNSQTEVKNEATTILKFNDDVSSSSLTEQPSYSKNDNHCLPTVSRYENPDQIHVDNGRINAYPEARRSSTTSQSPAGSSSRRKPLNPSRCSIITVNSTIPCGEDLVRTINSLSETQTSFSSMHDHNFGSSSAPITTYSMPIPMMSNGCDNSPTLVAQSNPTSPSTDSGVLDLSRAGSLVDSTPITPMKGLSISTESNIPLPLLSEVTKICSDHNTTLEAYQNQVDTLSQYQAAWSKVLPTGLQNMNMLKSENSCMATPTNDPINNRLALNLYQLAQHLQQTQQHQSVSPVNLQHYLSQSLFSNNTVSQFSPQFRQKWDSRPISAPNSPAAKGIRRQRMSTGSTRAYTGRATGMRRSTSSRRFSCNQCREEFPSLHTLEEHTVLTHGTYRCHICKAQFTQRSNLQRHALKHVGFKPFECRVCSKAYYRKDHLMRHMEMGHPGYTPRENITVHLTSSESLEYLNRSSSRTAIPNDSAMLTETNETTMDYSILGLDAGVIEGQSVDAGEIKSEDLPSVQTGNDNDVMIETTANDTTTTTTTTTTTEHEYGCGDITDQVNSDECHIFQNGDPSSVSCHDETNTKID